MYANTRSPGLEIVLNIKKLYTQDRLLTKDVEYDPYLLLFFSKEVDESGTVVKKIEYNDIYGYEQIVMRKLYPDVNGKQLKSTKSTMTIMMMCRKYIKNKNGHFKYHRYEPLGRTVIHVEELYDMYTNGKTKHFTIVDQTDTESDPIRSKIELRVEKFNRLNGLVIAKDYTNSLQVLNGYRVQKMQKVTDRYITAYTKHLVPTIQKYKWMHVPKWYASIQIPSVFFVTYLPRLSPELEYMEYILRTVLDSYGLDPNWFYDTIYNQCYGNPNGKFNVDMIMCAKVLGTACTTFANACDYLGDMSRQKDTERFIYIGLTYGGDCEDQAKDAYLVWMMYRRALRHRNIKMYKLTMMASIIAEMYIPGMSTGIASTPSLGGGKSKDGRDDICHMICVAIPRHFFFASLSRGYKYAPSKHLVAHKYTSLKTLKNDANTYTNLAEFPWEYRNRILILEGTNWCDNLQQPRHEYLGKDMDDKYHKQVEQNQSTIEGARWLIENQYKHMRELGVEISQTNVSIKNAYAVSETEISSFYRRQNNFWTMVSGIGLLDLSFGYASKQNEYSVDFRDLIESNDDISLMPVFDMDEEELNIGLDIVDQEYPIVSRKVPLLKEVRETLVNRYPNLQKLYMLQERYPAPQSNTNVSFSNLSIEERKTVAFKSNFIGYRVNHAEKISIEMVHDLERLLKKGSVVHYESNTNRKNFEAYINGISVKINPIQGDELYTIEIKIFIA